MNTTGRLLIFLAIVSLFMFPASSSAESGGKGTILPVLATVHKRPFRSAGITASGRQDDEITLLRHADAKQRPAAVARYTRTPRLKRFTAKTVAIIDADNGRLIYGKSPDLPRQPASTIKILTGLIAMEKLADGTNVSVSRRAAGMPRSKIYLDQRKSYKAGDLINAVLLASANDASVALAEKVAGSERNFAQLMTDKARELGACNTVCRTASGLTARGQKTTARDLATIFGAAMKKKEFAERISQVKIKTRAGHTLRNHNKALWSISGAEGGKTGYTRAAKQTYVGQFSRRDDTLLLAIMGSRTLWKDVGRLVEYGFAKIQQQRQAGAKSVHPADHAATQTRAAAASRISPHTAVRILSDSKKTAKL
jgi:D-alanyl-D-alanine carboxypeptidase (penicillin-binding protein 5/6)